MPTSIHSLRALVFFTVALGLSAPFSRPAPASATALQDAAAQPEAARSVAAEPSSRPAAPLIEIPNARRPRPGLLTGGQPTPEQLAAAAAAGFRTVVNLRGEAEAAETGEAAAVEKLGMRYVTIPIAGAAELSEEKALALAAVLQDDDAYPILLHCASGNRVGAVIALESFHAGGHEASAALELGREAGLTSLEPTVRELLGLPAEAP